MPNSKIAIAGVASALFLTAMARMPAYAQDAAEKVSELEEIIVIGYSASLAKSLDVKKESDTIVDAVSAEDIGRFPDINIADALQRVTGVQVERDERTGESARVSIRGTAPHLNRALLNNQQVASGTASNRRSELRDRNFNYFLLPTEIVETLEVYKSPAANIDEGSIGGTVIVRMRKPLDGEAGSGSISARYFYFENAGEQKPHVSGLYNWQNDAETFGVNVAYVYKESATQMDSKRNLGGFFRLLDVDRDGTTERLPVFPGSNRFISKYNLSTPFATLQYAPSEDLEFVFTAFRSNTEQESQGLLSQGFGSLATLLTPAAERDIAIQDRTVVSGSLPSCCAVLADPNLQAAKFESGIYIGDIETTAFDLKGEWRRDSLTASIQVGHSFAEGYVEDYSSQFGARSSLNFDISTGISETSFGDGLTPEDYAFQNTFVNRIRNESDEMYLQADFKFVTDSDFVSSIEAGVKFREHNKSASRNKRDFDEASFFGLDGSVEGTSLADFAGAPITHIQVGAAPSGLWELDAQRLFQWQADRPEVEGTANSSFEDPEDGFALNEKVSAAYVKLNFATENFRGNLGIRTVETNTKSTAKRFEGRNFNPRFVEDAVVGNDYTDVLPSININYVGIDDVIVRFAAAKVLSRPNYVNLTNSETRVCSPAANDSGYECTGREGNPDLEPFRSTQYDFSAEWYIDDYSFLALALFHKDIESYFATENIVAIRDYPVTVGDNPTIEQREFTLTRPINGLGGSIQGFELSYQQALPLSFGMQVNYTYADADLTETPEQIEAGIEETLLDHSEDTYNATLFYQNYGLNARVSYTFRSRYRYDIGAVGRGLNGYKDDFGQFDFNSSYALTDNIDLIFQVINLTNEEIDWYASDEEGAVDFGRPLGRFNHGRRYGLGLNMRF